MTVFTTAHSGVKFVPVNYHMGSPTVETVNMVRINYEKGKTTKVLSFAASNATCGLNYEPDVVVRKYPYDPTNPYYDTTLSIPL